MTKPFKPITLRNLPEPVARAVRERAAKYHISLNKAVIQILEQATGSQRPPSNELDRFFGTWTKEEADEFDRSLAEQRRIDPEMWK